MAEQETIKQPTLVDDFKSTEKFVSLTTQAGYVYPELDQPEPKYTEQDRFMLEGIDDGGSNRMFAPISAANRWDNSEYGDSVDKEPVVVEEDTDGDTPTTPTDPSDNETGGETNPPVTGGDETTPPVDEGTTPES